MLAAIVAATMLSGCSAGGPGGYRLVAYFTKTVSLYGQSDVRVLGMKVGTVRSVEAEGDRVRVALSIAAGVTLPQGVRATLVPQSLLGARYVQLYPAWVDGQPRLDPQVADQRVIGLDHTSIPAEPDEALAALKHLLDTLDPKATGRLVTNVADDVRGNGGNLNATVHSLAALSNTLAAKDQQLVELIDNFQQFTSVLDTRETQLGRIMDLFAQTTSLLAEERGTIAGLVTHLAGVATNALDLVGGHAAPLQSDLDNLAKLVATLDANLAGVSTLLSGLPELAAGPNLDAKGGLIAAYNPTYHRLDLRPDLGASANGLLQALGLPLCLAIPLLATQPQCAPGAVKIPPAAATAPRGAARSSVEVPPAAATAMAAPGAAASAAAGVTALAPIGTEMANPLGGVLNLLGSGGDTQPQIAGYGLVPPAPAGPRRGVAAQLARWSRHLLEALW